MQRIDIRQVNLFILRYRKILVALGFSFIVWTISQNPPAGNLVLIANQFVPANSALTAEQFSMATISDFDSANFISEYLDLESNFSQVDIAPGSLLSRDSITRNKVFNNRIDVFVTLENQGQINPGTHLHLWSQSEEIGRLISSDAIVRKSETDNYGTRLTVSIPMTDEYAVMQSQGIKVSLVN